MKTTRGQFEQFKVEFRRWQDLLGLTDWRVCFEHDKIAASEKAYAIIYPNCEGRIATVIYNTELDMKDGSVIGYDPVNTGRHETLELLLARLKDLALSRNVKESDVHEEVHVVIRRLENLFDGEDTWWKDERKKGKK